MLIGLRLVLLNSQARKWYRMMGRWFNQSVYRDSLTGGASIPNIWQMNHLAGAYNHVEEIQEYHHWMIFSVLHAPDAELMKKYVWSCLVSLIT